MKKISYLLLMFLVLSCSNEDSPNPVEKPADGIPADDIPADRKFLETLDRSEDDLRFFYEDGKVKMVKIADHTSYIIGYEDNRIVSIYLSSYRTASTYFEFAYSPEGKLNGYLLTDLGTGELAGYQPLVYNAETNSYNDWYYMYSDGSTRKTIIDGVERTFVYDYTKKGAFYNTNYDVIKYLQLVYRRAINWDAYVGRFPCKQVIYVQGPLEMENTCDSQGFISKSHMDSTLNNLDATYNYIKI